MNHAEGQSEARGAEMHALLRELFPHFRGLAGEGSRRTLSRLAELIPLEIHEVPSGTQVFDWTVPDEWRFRDAYVKDAAGRRVIDARALNLHVITHSRPVRRMMTWAELRPHLHTLPDRPTLVPYRHTFYEDGWGFCLSHKQLEQMEREAGGPYEVCIDADLFKGSLLYGECVLPGDEEGEVLLSAHACHPSMANDNLSGVVVQAFLAHALTQRHRRFTYRLLFAPATIGVLAWLHRNQHRLDSIIGGLVLANLGDSAPLAYRRSRRGDAPIDRAAAMVLPASCMSDFDPTGGDERQYGSPGFDLPIGALMRSGPGAYPEYHTSGDDLTFVSGEQLKGAVDACLTMLERFENSSASAAPATRKNPQTRHRRYENPVRHGEPQLGRRGVLAGIRREPDPGTLHQAALWTLNLSDGHHDLRDIAARSGLSLTLIERAVALLLEYHLLHEAGIPAPHVEMTGTTV